MSNEFNIKSSTVEIGLELAKEFLGKLITPAVEETGLLIKDQVTFWRFKNQVKILNKAERYCEKHNIKPKKISFKLLTPLLENSSLEEEEVLQDKWAILLSNLVDSEQNVENHVFPYILGQISKKEFLFIEKAFSLKKDRINNMQPKIDLMIEKVDLEKQRIEKEIQQNLKKVEHIKQGAELSQSIWELENLNYKLNEERCNIDRLLFEFDEASYGLEELSKELEEFEFSHLVRLGLIKERYETRVPTQRLNIPKEDRDSYGDLRDDLSVDVDLDLETNSKYILVELGELFIKACSEKKG